MTRESQRTRGYKRLSIRPHHDLGDFDQLDLYRGMNEMTVVNPRLCDKPYFLPPVRQFDVPRSVCVGMHYDNYEVQTRMDVTKQRT